MANKTQQRTGTAASWTSTNPTLSQGEIANEYDTGKFKIGTGSTVWNSLAYSGATGATQTLPYRSFGDGSDGNVTVSAGVTTLPRDMYYNNLTINSTGTIYTCGYKIFVKGILDLTAAPEFAINCNGKNGGDASGATGGSTTAPDSAASVGTGGAGSAGVTGTTGAGGQAVASAALSGGNGGISGAGGLGGTGTNAGGASRTGTTPSNTLDLNKFETNLLRGILLLSGGAGGPGGSAGGGDNTNTGGGGGGGGTGGCVLALYAKTILKSTSTPANCISANGGNGGHAGSSSAGVTGGGGGGGAGGGGWVYICFNSLSGPVVQNCISASGGAGGNGGNGFGTGGLGGNGGNGGYGGRITLINVLYASRTVDAYAATSTLYVPSVTTGMGAFGSAGGTGCLPGLLKTNL